MIQGSTLHVLQELGDGAFHRLCDAVLRRREVRYRDLQPHGLNDRNQSIKGQPDSFVGSDAAGCTIAMCYSTERGRWWAKAIDDVRTVKESCPEVKEIVVVTSRDTTRDVPAKQRKDWTKGIREASAGTQLTVFGGRQLAVWLDNDYLDLRREFLNIPYSRLSWGALLASSHDLAERVLSRWRSTGRFESATYSPRRADQEFFDLWQASIDPRSSDHQATLIPVVGGAGVGKTAVVAHFVESSGRSLPILLLEGRSLAFGSPEAITSASLHALQGVLDERLRSSEEAAVASHFSDGRRLTVIVDALDEATCTTEDLRRSIDGWLDSRLGRTSILIVTCRLETWRLLGPERWARFVQSRRRTLPPNWDELLQDGGERPQRDAAFPARFTAPELARAWQRRGQPIARLYALPRQVRDQLTHPFTLKAYLSLVASSQSEALPDTAAGIVSAWLNERLKQEADESSRLSPGLLSEALEWTARELSAKNSRWLSVDRFEGAPRFSRDRPPGPAVESLLRSSILESHPTDTSLIGFAEELVFDHCLAGAEAADARRAPAEFIRKLEALSFSRARTKIERLALGGAIDSTFATQLYDLDPCLAAVFAIASPETCSYELQRRIANALARLVSGASTVDAVFAIELLGRMGGLAAEETLTSLFPSHTQCPKHLRAAAGTACLRIGSSSGTEIAYEHPWFGGAEVDFFADLLWLVRGAAQPIQSGLRDRALAELSNRDYRRRVRSLSVLGYLAESQLAALLADRTGREPLLDHNETYALLALGDEGIETLDAFGRRLAAEMATHASDHERQSKLYHRLPDSKGSLRAIASTGTHELARRWILDASPEVTRLGRRLARGLQSVELVHLAIVTSSHHDSWNWIHEEGPSWIRPSDWLELWEKTPDVAQHSWLHLLPAAPTPAIEEVAISCLEKPRLVPAAARYLARIRSERARRSLRGYLVAHSTEKVSALSEVVRALGVIGDANSVETLARVCRENSDADLASMAALALGQIGGELAERELMSLLEWPKWRDLACAALIRHGSRAAVQRVLEEVKRDENGPKLLVEICTNAFHNDGWRLGHYFVHIDAAPIVEYFRLNLGQISYSRGWEMVDCLRSFDSPSVRAFLRQLTSHVQSDRAAGSDGRTISSMAQRELEERGDPFVLPLALEDALSAEDHPGWRLERLKSFNSVDIVVSVKRLLAVERYPTRLAKLVRLLAAHGVPQDAAMLNEFLVHPDPELAGVARAARLTLVDPLRAPDGWSVLYD